MMGIRGGLLFCLVVALGFLGTGVTGKPFLSNTLGDHMVLQQAPERAKLWGWTNSPRQPVHIFFGNFSNQVSSGDDGSWSVSLPPTPAGGPHNISISSPDAAVVLHDVLFGEVWLCGGQSNMVFTVLQGFDGQQEATNSAQYPHIRLFTVGDNTFSNQPLDTLKTVLQPWSVPNARSVGGGNWMFFSGVCWYFAKEMYTKNKVPVGVISNNWGGTIIEAWMSPDALGKCHNNNDNTKHFNTPLSKSEEMFVPPNDPSLLWNAMINPYLPMRLSGVIWYQGEANVRNFPESYKCNFPAMITDWRTKFSNDFPFFFVQLAPFDFGVSGNWSIPWLRQHQLEALKLPKTAVATAIDLGDPTSPFGAVHPRNKQDVGKRLFRCADNIVYGQNTPYIGPSAVSFKVSFQDGDSQVVEVIFADDSVSGGLINNKEQPKCPPKYHCSWVELQFSNNSWVNATTDSLRVTSNTTIEIDVEVPSGLEVVGVRYAWSDWPIATLYNGAGLPALPFIFEKKSTTGQHFTNVPST